MSYKNESILDTCVLCGNEGKIDNIIRNDFYGSTKLVFTDPDTNIRYFGQCCDIKFYCD